VVTGTQNTQESGRGGHAAIPPWPRSVFTRRAYASGGLNDGFA